MSQDLTRLLYITPPAGTSAEPCDDELTAAMEAAFADAEITTTWRGHHRCACGERSGSSDYAVGRFETNSLCVHYLRWHRYAVPVVELNKVRELAGMEPLDEANAAPVPVDPARLQAAVDAMLPRVPTQGRGGPSVGLFQMMSPRTVQDAQAFAQQQAGQPYTSGMHVRVSQEMLDAYQASWPSFQRLWMNQAALTPEQRRERAEQRQAEADRRDAEATARHRATAERFDGLLRTLADLHAPLPMEGVSGPYCGGCDDSAGYSDELPAWPCTTFRTVEEA